MSSSSPGITIDIQKNSGQGAGSTTYKISPSKESVSLRKEEYPPSSGFWKFTHIKDGAGGGPFEVTEVQYNGRHTDIKPEGPINSLSVWYWDQDFGLSTPLLVEIKKSDNKYDYHFNKGGSGSNISWQPLSGNSKSNQLTGNDLEAKLDHLNCNLNQAVTITLTFEHSSHLSETHAKNSGRTKYCCDYHNPRGVNDLGNITVNKGEIRVNSAKKADYFKHTINSGDYKLAKIKYDITRGGGIRKRIKSSELAFPVTGSVSVYVFYCKQNPALIYVKGTGQSKWYKKPNDSSTTGISGDERWEEILPELKNTTPEDISRDKDCDKYNKLVEELYCAHNAKCPKLAQPSPQQQGPSGPTGPAGKNAVTDSINGADDQTTGGETASGRHTSKAPQQLPPRSSDLGTTSEATGAKGDQLPNVKDAQNLGQSDAGHIESSDASNSSEDEAAGGAEPEGETGAGLGAGGGPGVRTQTRTSGTGPSWPFGLSWESLISTIAQGLLTVPPKTVNAIAQTLSSGSPAKPTSQQAEAIPPGEQETTVSIPQEGPQAAEETPKAAKVFAGLPVAGGILSWSAFGTSSGTLAGSAATFFGGWKLYNRYKGDPWVRQI
ncbi:hypothetical protein BEWA_029740 [Theileria equi strain WA]|uniref:Uncharacterized protein n=1 Tax=Theileria equi strain WA TaxID=1537102 RepID=L0AXX8_THEEQ|nr:hypothetical protein BEWA_029740 [Theileria equi strain WA]AFZ80123.1 hypothetical protein BEWA_029740 [Theileria equi strain WA]|eukprot:XP_004829789.1 hypothetical protein BEWA_029740 [Theileria equi strain WA]